MLDVKIDPLPWWDRLRASFTKAGRRSRMECHRQLVAALVEFRLNDYEKAVTPRPNADRRRVVQVDLSDILSGESFLGKPGEELARAIEEGIQLRMPDETLWYQIACLSHAGRFAKDTHLAVKTASPAMWATAYVPGLSQGFPFLNQPIEIISAPPGQPPSEARLSGGLTSLLRQWLDGHVLPEIRYKFVPDPRQWDWLQQRAYDESDPAVATVPTGWHPVGNQMKGTYADSTRPC